MKVRVNVSEIKKAIINAAMVASKNKNIPVLTHTLLTAQDGKLTITATDLEVTYTARVPAEIQDEGACLIPAVHFKKILARLSGELTISVSENSTFLSCGTFRTRFDIPPVEDFPEIQQPQPGTWVDPEKLRDAFSSVIHATLKDEWPPTFTGICIKRIGDSIFACATDRTRLAMAQISIPELTPMLEEFESHVIIPAYAVKQVIKITKQAESVGIVVDNEQISFTTTSEETILARLIHGKFPEVESVLFDPVCSIEVSDQLIHALRQAALATKGGVTLKFDDKLHLHAADRDIEYERSLDVTVNGKHRPDPLLLNVQYLIQASSNAGEGACLGLDDKPGSPVMVFSDGYKEFIAPMREE